MQLTLRTSVAMHGSPARQAILVIALGALLVFPGLGRRDLWNPVEPRYAGIAAELERGGELLTPRYNGAPYDQKPPLFFWLGALALRLGNPEHALWLVRLPSALGALLILVGTWLLGQRLLGGMAGFWGALTLGASWHVGWSGRFCHLDTLTVAALLWGWLGLLGAAQGPPRQRRAWILLAGLAIGGGLLLKGPAPLAITVLVLVSWAAIHRDWQVLGRTGLLPAAAIGLLLALAWLIPAWSRSGSAWGEELVLRQGLGRLLDPLQPHKHRWWYYPVIFWGAAGPWSLLLPVTLSVAWRRDGASPRHRAGLTLCAIWVGLVLAALLLGETRRSRYLMPALPPAALLVGWLLEHRVLGPAGSGSHLARWLAALAAGLAATAGLGAALVLGAAAWLAPRVGELVPLAGEGLRELARGGSLVVVLAAGLALLGILTLLLVASRRRVGALLAAIGTLGLLWATWGLVGAPAVDRVRHDLPTVALIRQIVQEEGRRPVVLGRLGHRESALGYLGFHLGRTLEHRRLEEGGVEDLQAGSEPILLLLRDRCHQGLAENYLEGWLPVRPRPLGHHRLWLYRNPASEPAENPR
jgi:4-amino-4-deoxy-L-arabinose transferase-like glycosyltransferase